MSRRSLRLIRAGVVAVPVVGLLLAFHFLAPGVRDWLRGRSLPPGYEKRGEYGPYVLFARPGNRAAPAAAAILLTFTDRVLADWGEELGLAPDGVRTQVVVFSDSDDLETFGKSELGSDFEFNGGFYLPVDRTIGVVGDGDARALVGPLLHEGAHMMLDFWVRGAARDWSRWFDEGLAGYFEASPGMDRGGPLGGADPRLVALSVRSILKGDWISIDDLVRAPAEVWSAEKNWRYYAKSSLLTHYLIEGEGGARRDEYLALFRREREPGEVGVDDLREILGPLDEVDRALAAHVLSLR